MTETEQEHARGRHGFRHGFRRGAVAAALTGLTMLAGVPAAHAERPLLPGVGPGDRRAPVDAAADPWRSVVRVQTNLAGRCTGALVGRRTVVTAGHCLFNPRTRRFLQASSLHVLFGYDRGDFTRHVTVARVATDPAYDPAAATPMLGGDWAVLTLAEPAPDQVPPLPVSVAPLRPGTPLMLGGYSQERAQILMADRACQLLAESGGLLVHDCDATRGTSGGPLLVRTADGGGANGIGANGGASGGGWAVAGVGVAAGNAPSVRNFAVPSAHFAALLAKDTAAGQP